MDYHEFLNVISVISEVLRCLKAKNGVNVWATESLNGMPTKYYARINKSTVDQALHSLCGRMSGCKILQNLFTKPYDYL